MFREQKIQHYAFFYIASAEDIAIQNVRAIRKCETENFITNKFLHYFEYLFFKGK